MSHFPFLNSGNYPFTNLDNVNLDWFIEDAFRMKQFVKAEVEDLERMKKWVLNNVVKVDVIKALVDAVNIKKEDKEQIKQNLEIADLTPTKIGQAVATMEITDEQKTSIQNKLGIYPITDAEGVIF